MALLSGMFMAGVVTACSDDDLPQASPDTSAGNEVRISATIGDGSWNELSRSVKDVGGVSIKEFSGGDKIVVDSWYLPAGAESTSEQPDFMRRQEMTYDGTNWNYSPIKYWPNNPGDRLVFWAYHAAGADNKFTVTENDAVTGYPKMIFNENPYANDVLVSEVIISDKPVQGKVSLEFHHILAYIKMQVKVVARDGAQLPDDYSIDLIEVYHHNMPLMGTFLGFDAKGPVWDNEKTHRYTFKKADNGNFIYDAVNNEYTKVADGTGDYTYSGNTSVHSTKEVTIKPTDGFVDITDFYHVTIPFDTDWVDQNPDGKDIISEFSISFTDNRKNTDSDGDVGGGFTGGNYGYVFRPSIDFKAGTETTIKVTIGVYGIGNKVEVDNVEYEQRAIAADWSGNKVGTSVTFEK